MSTHGDDHGFPTGGPAFPYEVGVAFFEAAQGGALPEAWRQAASWWVAQAAVNPGRGMTAGERPLNWHDVLLVAEGAGLGPWALTLLHLRGSWEESQGALAEEWGTDRGPVRLLEVPLRHFAPDVAASLWRRFLVREAAHADGAGTFSPAHHTVLAQTWAGACADLSSATRDELRALAPAAVADDLDACP